MIYRDVFKADLPESIKVVDTMTKQFGISSQQAYNLLAQGAQSGLDKSGELLDSVNEYSNQFKGLGFSANEMFDLFASGLDSGAFNLDKVGDAVKEFGIRSKDSSTASLEAFKALGFNAKKMTATFAGGGPAAKKAFTQVMQAIDQVKDPVKKNTIGVALLGTQFEDLGSGAVAALANVESSFNSTTDTMSQLNNVKYSDIDSAISGIKRTLEASIVTPLADKVLPKLGEFSAWVTSKTPAIKQGIDNAFKTGKDIINGFGDAMAWAKQNADWLVPAIGAVTGAVIAQQAANGIAGIVKAYKAWRVTTEGMTLAQWALNTAMSANPFGWIALAIGALIGVGILLYKNWDVVKAKASELWNWLSGVWTNLKEGTINVFNGVKESVAGAFSSMVGAAKTPINSIIGMVNGLIGKLNSISFSIPDWVPGDMGGKTFGVNIPTIPTFAKGTNNAPGGPSVVGEEGPEIVNLKKGDTVTTANKTKKLLSGNQNINININVGTVYGDGVDDLLNRIGNELTSIITTTLPNMAR
ncbi:Phage-related minor tail protein [compost metagenome]